jgi:hypothetical protein
VPRKPSHIDHDWRHSTTLESSLIHVAAKRTEPDMRPLSHPHLKVVMDDKACPRSSDKGWKKHAGRLLRFCSLQERRFWDAFSVNPFNLQT